MNRVKFLITDTLNDHPQAQKVLFYEEMWHGPRITRVSRTEQTFFQSLLTRLGDMLMYSPLKFKSARDLLFKAPQPFGAVTCFYEEHLSLIDSHAMFKDSVTEHRPGALNLNLSTVQSFFRVLNPPTSI